ASATAGLADLARKCSLAQVIPAPPGGVRINGHRKREKDPLPAPIGRGQGSLDFKGLRASVTSPVVGTPNARGFARRQDARWSARRRTGGGGIASSGRYDRGW